MRRIRQFLPFAILLAAAAGVWASGVAGQLNWAALGRNHASLVNWVARHPIGAPALYAALYTAATALSLPEAAVLTVAGGLLFGTWLGGVMAVIGSTAGAVVLFVAARSVFAATMAARGGARLGRIRDELHRNGFLYLLAIRLVPLFPFWLVNLAAALAGMRLLPYVGATFLGVIPATFVYAGIGAGIGDVLAAGQRPDLTVVFSPAILVPLLALAALALLPVAWRHLSGAPMPDFDLAVIGAGAAGLSVTAVAAQLGLKVALIERARMGGDCLNSGCVPSKALLAASHAVTAAREAGRFGLRLDAPTVDWPAVQAHVRGVIAALEPVDSEARFRALGATVLRGHARFVAADALDVDGRRITARRIVVAAGSRAAVPPVPGLDAVPFLTNETVFDLSVQPDHLLILGGGPIGLEMADAFAGLGSRVTVVEAATIASREDPELVAGLRSVLAASGVTLLEGTAVAAVEPGPALLLADGRRVAGSHLLVAVGRRPNLEGLELDAGGVRASPGGVVTDRGLRSVTNRRVYAVGDIADPAGIGPRAFTHVGSYHAGVVIRRAVFRLPARIDYRALPRVTYTHPELAQVGLTEAEARAAGHAVRVLRWPMADNDRAAAERDATGLVKLVVARGRVLGVGILASGAGEMISLWGLAVAQRTRVSALAGLIVPYPTRSEAGKRAAGSLFAPRLFSARTKRLVRWLAWLG